MANNPKKVKDPTEVALSAIQEALNISDTTVDTSRNSSIGSELAPPTSAVRLRHPIPKRLSARAQAPSGRCSIRSKSRAAPVAPPMTIAKPSDRFCRRSRRAALPAASTRWPPCSAASGWSAARLLTISFLPALQAAIGQSGGVLVLAGLAALFFAPVLLFYFLASLAWRGQEMRMIAQSMAQVAIRFLRARRRRRRSRW